MRALLQSNTVGHYRASGDQANLAPKLEPLKEKLFEM